jgi:long-chain acyl-CoA synthetase
MNFLRKKFDNYSAQILLSGDINATYAQVKEELQNGFEIEENSLVVLAVSDGTAGLLAYLSCILASAVILPLPEQLGEDRLNNVISTYRPAYVVSKGSINLPDGVGVKSVRQLTLFSKALLLYEIENPTKDIPSELALLLSTSGSTGDPKLVKLTEKNIEYNTHAICKSLALHANDVTITLLPLNYSFGISVVNSHIVSGGRIVCTDAGVVTKEFWEKISDEKVTALYGVPYQFEAMHRFKILSKEFPDIRFFAQAGGSLKEKVKIAFHDACVSADKKFYIMYGQTECSPRISCFSVTENSDKIDSVGRPLAGCDVSINAEDNEIIVSGKTVFFGYAETISDICKLQPIIKHRTGDVGFIDSDGFLYVTGRLKRYVKVFGHNINLDQVEKVLNEKFTNVVVCGPENMIVIFCDNKDKQKEEILNFVRDSFAVPMQAVKYNFVESVPRLSSGKVDYAKLMTTI